MHENLMQTGSSDVGNTVLRILFNFPTLTTYVVVGLLLCLVCNVLYSYYVSIVGERKRKKKHYIRTRLRSRVNEYSKERKIKTVVVSWNVGSKVPEKNKGVEGIQQFLDVSKSPADIYVFGLQEVAMSPQSFVFPTVMNSKCKKWMKILKSVFTGYRYIPPQRYGGLFLCVFVHNKHLPYMSDLRMEQVNCGKFGLFANKGGLGLRFKFYESSLCFLNCHMIHGHKKSKSRNKQYHIIRKGMNFQMEKEKDHFNCENHDIIFWLGDINYRLNLSFDEVVSQIDSVEGIKGLSEHDQMKLEKEKNNIFLEYKEGEITFKPTYKWLKAKKKKKKKSEDEQSLVNLGRFNEKRIPSYPDRILWRENNDHKVECKSYSASIDFFYFSDHKPVFGLYEFNVKVREDEKYKKILNDVNKEFCVMNGERSSPILYDGQLVNADNVDEVVEV